MFTGLTTAASGMLADERLQQMLSNNLANAQTPGFKTSDGSILAFPQQLMMQMQYGSNSGTPIGTMGTGATFQEGVPLFIQGMLQNSGRNLDVALVDSTPPGTYAAVAGAPAGGGNGPAGNAAAGNAAAGNAQTPPNSLQGTVTAGAGGRLSVQGQPLAVLGSSGQVLSGVYAAVNPNYKGTALYAADGKPNYDPNGNPSYLFVNAKGAVLGQPGEPGWSGAAIRIGNQNDMGLHSFYAVAYQSPAGPSGIALTRDGHFDVNANHQLVDASGNAVLPVNAAGKPLYNARIVLNTAYQGSTLFGANGQPVIDRNGQPSYRVVDTAGNTVPGARLGSVNADVTQLTPLGQTEFMVGGTLNPTQVSSQLKVGTGTMKPGELEDSNVNMTATMGQMLAAISSYEANQRVVQTENTMLTQAVQQIGQFP